MLSLAVAADSVRAVVPCSLLSLSMVPFATVSLGIGGASWILPKKAFQVMDNTLYRAYLRLCLFVFENVSAVDLKLYGDIDDMQSKEESVLVLSNHQTNVDWAVLAMLSARQGKQGSEAAFRVMVKQAIHYVPLFGWYIFQHGYIYVRRFGDFVGGPVLRQLEWLNGLDEKYWLMVFPEGTRFTRSHQDKIDASNQFCVKRGFPTLNNVLCPRAGGVHMAVERMTTLDAVYDVTIAYGQTRNCGRQGLAPEMFEFCCGPLIGRSVSVHVKRYPIDEVPKEKAAVQVWIMQRYQEKDQMLSVYQSTGQFPDPYPHTSPAISILRTLPPTLFFSAALVAPIFSPLVRKLYKYTICSFPFLILWLKVRKCV